jgi:hypothetical protein
MARQLVPELTGLFVFQSNGTPVPDSVISHFDVLLQQECNHFLWR